METLAECNHNDVVTLTLKICGVNETSIPQRAFELKVHTQDSDIVSLIIWQNTPAAAVDWVVDTWYQMEHILVKQWDSHTELNATKQTTARQVKQTTDERPITGGDRKDVNTTKTEDGDSTTSTSKTVEPNRVSELYEAFRSLQTVLDAIIEYPGSAVSSSETSHPLVQYHSVIQAVIGDGDKLPEKVDGLGRQQAKRVPSEMSEYRAEYGSESPSYRTKYPTNGSASWVTDYQVVATAQLADEAQEALEERDIVEDASVFDRPVAPETETPLPVITWTVEELEYALSLLSQFKARPELPWDKTDPRMFPIEEVYDRICTVEEIGANQRATLDDDTEDQLLTPTSINQVWETTQKVQTDRCGFVWPPNEHLSGEEQRASCCYRETWRGFDRCIWHADTEINKPIEELRDARESESNQLHNHLPREILAGATLRDTQITNEILTGVDFRGADLEGSDFTGSYLSYSTFSDANLRAADLTKTTVSRVSFQNADLTTAKLSGLSLFNNDFTGATLTNANFTDANIDQAIIRDTNIEDAIGVNTDDGGETELNDDPTLVVTTDTYVDRKNMSRIKRQKDYLSVFGEIIQHAVESDADAVLHLGNLFWSKKARDRAGRRIEEYLLTLADHDIEFFLVKASRDVDAGSKVLAKFEQQNLLTILDSGWHQFGNVGLFVHGFDAEPIANQTSTPPTDVKTTIATLYDSISNATTYSKASEFEAALGSELDLILTGTPTAEFTNTRNGTPLLSPGMPERIIGKSIIDSDPSAPGFLRCKFTDEGVKTVHRKTAARPAVGFRIELFADATKTDVHDTLPADLPTDAAVIFDIEGEKNGDSLSKKEVEKIVSQRAEIVRGYDNRIESDIDTDPTTSGEKDPQGEVSKAEAQKLLEQEVGEGATFRPQQWEAIDKLVNDNGRLLLVQRTGWGKSSVYFIATQLLRERGAGPTLIISPLLSLMRNQIQDAEENLGLKAATINSNNTDSWEETKQAVVNNSVDLLLISPERLANQDFRSEIMSKMTQDFGMLVVDEAHCISDWGHDFRPDYRRIKRIIERLPRNVPVAATTATANNRVVDDVTTQLPDLEPLRGSLMRESLHIQAMELKSRERRLAWLAENVPETPHTGIIYCLTKNEVETVADWLTEQGLNVEPYHGSLDGDIREEREQLLLNNNVDALVATNALGMGFNKPDLGFVVHFQRPPNLIQYYQEIGRAGRKLDDAYAILLSGDDDDDIAEYFIETAFPIPSDFGKVLSTIEESDEPLDATDIIEEIDISERVADKCLNILLVERAIVREDSGYVRTANSWNFDSDRIEEVTNHRWEELARIQEFVETDECLMLFINDELDGNLEEPCGQCANCSGEIVPTTVRDESLIREAIQHFQSEGWNVIKPRKMVYLEDGGKKPIEDSHRVKPGRTLSIWDNPGWGTLVREGKYEDGHFDDELVEAAADLIRDEWDPDPAPTWVTSVPSTSEPDLIADYARRLAAELGIEFRDTVEKVTSTKPQKHVKSSYQKCWNVQDVFETTGEVKEGPVLLVDDVVASRWTLTEVGKELRKAGSEVVYPLALAERRGE